MKTTYIKMAAAALLLGPLAGWAADYPIKDKTVTLIVPFAAGGPTDRVARDLAEAMRKLWARVWWSRTPPVAPVA